MDTAKGIMALSLVCGEFFQELGMDISKAQQAKSFQLSRLTPPIKPDAINEAFSDNHKVDLVVEDQTGVYVLSGDKVSLAELGNAAPEIALNLAPYDLDKDGFLVESEFKTTQTEIDAANKKYESYKQEVDKKKTAFLRQYDDANDYGLYGLTADITVWLSKPDIKPYRTAEWNKEKWQEPQPIVSYKTTATNGNISVLGPSSVFNIQPSQPQVLPAVLRLAR